MQKKVVTHPEIKLVGIQVRTSYKNELSPSTSKIGPLVGRYWGENIAKRITARKHPGITLVAYTRYETDEYGEYDYLIGEEVSALDELPKGLTSVTIPAGNFLKLTSQMGKMPDIIVSTWKQIWAMTTANALGGRRSYVADFEVYDQRALDPNNTVFDVYLGII